MRSLLVASSFVGAFVVGCAPQIGDSCNSGLDCAITGDRVCDVSTQGGQCVIYGCERGTCPSEAVCVRFRPEESRLSYTACMKRCENAGGCRLDEGYDCLRAEDIIDPSTDAVLAELIEGEEDGSFCVATDPAVD